MYIVRFTVGKAWDGKRFIQSPAAFEFNDLFHFQEQGSDERVSDTEVVRHRSATGWTVTLHPVPQGNARSRPIPVEPLEDSPQEGLFR
jgi:hypothetical protein